jgi:hypothetical protein
MGRTKEQVMDAIAGFEFGEVEAGSSPRIRRILALEKRLGSGTPPKQVDDVLDQLRTLKRLPPVEFDYEPEDGLD